jgi:uncharacterized membrane protein
MNIWQRRIIRLWLVALLPIALIFGYFCNSSHQESVFWQEQVSHWHKVVYRNEPSGLEATKSELQQLFDDSVQSRNENLKKRKYFGIAFLVLIFFPVLTWLFGRIGKWVWSVESK